MKLSISEARRRLPELVRQVRKDASLSVEITVHDEVVAELRAIQPLPEPGEAARRLLELRKKLARKGRKARAHDVSSHVKEHLYGPKGVIR
jgi:antitoxin (DNA-binding transcriptional repressor) of toxin-antitoxin stability system